MTPPIVLDGELHIDSRRHERAAILREIFEAADRLQPITAAINRGDASRIAESESIQREIEALYDRRAALWPGDDKPLPAVSDGPGKKDGMLTPEYFREKARSASFWSAR